MWYWHSSTNLSRVLCYLFSTSAFPGTRDYLVRGETDKGWLTGYLPIGRYYAVFITPDPVITMELDGCANVAKVCEKNC